MSDTSAAKLKRSTKAEEIIGTRTAQKTVATTQAAETEEIKSNPLYKIIVDPALSNEEKSQALAVAFSKAQTEAEVRELEKQFAAVRKFVQAYREKLALSIIDLTSVDDTAIMQDMFVVMNEGMLEFNEALEPILAIGDAMNTARKHGKTNEIFAELRREKQDAAVVSAEKQRIQIDLESTTAEIEGLRRRNDMLAQKKSWFGFGSVSPEALADISGNDRSIASLQMNIDELGKKVAELDGKAIVDDNSELGQAKATIRSALINLSSSEHQNAMKKAVEKARGFVVNSGNQIDTVEEAMQKKAVQIDRLKDANKRITSMSAIIAEGLKGAESETGRQRSEIAATDVGENVLRKMERDEKLAVVDHKAKFLTTAVVSTTKDYADTASQAVRIDTMKNSNSSAVNGVVDMRTQGVAGIADRLNITLQSVGQAALSESAAIAKDTLNQMVDYTNEVAMRESIRQATSLGAANEDLIRTMGELADYNTIVAETNSIVAGTMSEIRANVDLTKQAAAALEKDVKEGQAIFAAAAEEARAATPGLVTPRKTETTKEEDDAFGGL